MRREVHLVELTVMPGVRYSAVLGYLHAAVATDPELDAACSVHKHVHMQSSSEFETTCAAVLDTMHDPLAAAFTIYFWNRERTLELARRVKQRWPRCRIVFGGNDVTHQHIALFAEAPWADVLVHGEGELRLRQLLRAFLRCPDPGDPIHTELAEIAGISFPSAAGHVVTTPAAPRIADLAEIPSPLLTDGVYSDADIAATRMIVYETNRGCPYSCAFCYWGGATNSKVRQFPEERVLAELDRIVRLVRQGAQLFIADANFGLLPRDVGIAEALITMCLRHRKRIVVMTNWAKNTNDRVLRIAEMLHAAGLTGAITLSAQSFDPGVLELAHRSNIRPNQYKRMQEEFRRLGVPTYTDLIWGLPGESLTSFRHGIEEVLANGGSPVVYPLLLLNNTDYTSARFSSENGLRARHLPCDPGNFELFAKVVTEHARMTHPDWLHGMQLRIPLTIFQKCLLRSTMRVLSTRSGVRLIDMVEELLHFLDTDLTEPLIPEVMANYRASWERPDAFDRETLYGAVTAPVIHEEMHFQAILHTVVADEGRLRTYLDAAVDFLLARLPAMAGPGADIPDRGELDGLLSLDVAASSIFRAGIRGAVERRPFRLPLHQIRQLAEIGDYPPWKDDRDDPPNTELGDHPTMVSGEFIVPPHRAHYPFSAYALSVWHGSGRPLHDGQLIIERTRIHAGTAPAVATKQEAMS